MLINCNWYYPSGSTTPLISNSSAFTYTVPADAAYNERYSVTAEYVGDTSIAASKLFTVSPETMIITAMRDNLVVGDTALFMATDGGETGDIFLDCYWELNGELLSTEATFEPDISFTVTDAMIGTNTLVATYGYNSDITASITFTVSADDSGGTDPDPEPSESPEPSPEPSGDWVTNSQMNSSQSSQTSTIIASIESESTIIQNAIQSLETTLSNSNIYQLFTQSFVYYDFDFTTGKLSTTGLTLDGFVPTFNHWAQNVEEYLGMLVDVRASEVEEEVKEESGGFWNILLSLFKPKDNGDKATANTDDMNTILGLGDDVRRFYDSGGSVGDVVTVLGSNELWLWFTDEAAADLDTTITTFDRGEPVKDFYGESYSNFYENVLGRKWGDS